MALSHAGLDAVNAMIDEHVWSSLMAASIAAARDSTENRVPIINRCRA
jgi:hypothetical protein